MDKQPANSNGEAAALRFIPAFSPEHGGSPETLDDHQLQDMIYPFDVDYGNIETRTPGGNIEAVSVFERPKPDGVVLLERIHEYFASNSDASFQVAVAAVRALVGTPSNRENPGEVQKLNYVIDAVRKEFGESDSDSGAPQKLRIPIGDYLERYVQVARVGVSQLEHYRQFVHEAGNISFEEVGSNFQSYAQKIESSPTYDWQYWQGYFMDRASVGSDPDVIPPLIQSIRDTEDEVIFPKAAPGTHVKGLEIARNIKHANMDQQDKFVLEPSPEVGYIVRQIRRLSSAEDAVAVLDAITELLFDRITSVKDDLEIRSGRDVLDSQITFRDNEFPFHVAETAFETVALKRHFKDSVSVGANLDEAVTSYLDSKSWNLELDATEEPEQSILDSKIIDFIDVIANVVEPLGEEGRAEAGRLFDRLLAEETVSLYESFEKYLSNTRGLVNYAVVEVEGSDSSENKFDTFLDRMVGKAKAVDILHAIKSRMAGHGTGLGQAKDAALAEADSPSAIGLENVLTGWVDEWLRESDNYRLSLIQSREGKDDERRLPVSEDELGGDYSLLQKFYMWNDKNGAINLAHGIKRHAGALMEEQMARARSSGSKKQNLIDLFVQIETTGQADYDQVHPVENGTYDGERLFYPEPGVPFNLKKITEFRQRLMHSAYGHLISKSEKADQMLGHLEGAPTVQHAVHAYLKKNHGIELGEPESSVEPIDVDALALGLKHSFLEARAIMMSYVGESSEELLTLDTSGQEASNDTGEQDEFVDEKPQVVDVSFDEDGGKIITLNFDGEVVRLNPPSSDPETLRRSDRFIRGKVSRLLSSPNPSAVDDRVTDELINIDPKKLERSVRAVIRRKKDRAYEH
jgi:hypothetical protein